MYVPMMLTCNYVMPKEESCVYILTPRLSEKSEKYERKFHDRGTKLNTISTTIYKRELSNDLS